MCCIIPSINSPIPGMPNGKPAGTMCVNLDPVTFRCNIWGTDQYPKFCRQFAPTPDVCGQSQDEARELLRILEEVTKPATTKQ
jgi:hypothetical protein